MAKPDPKKRLDPPPTPSSAYIEEKAPRISFLLTKDGKPDYGRMHTSTREQLEKMFPPSSASTAAAPAADVMSVELINTLLDSLSPFVTAANARRFHITREQATPELVAALGLTPAYKQALAPPLTKLANKYGSSVLERWGDELAAVVAATSVIQAQSIAIRAILREQRPPATVTPFPQPQPKPESQDGKPSISDDQTDEILPS